MIHNKMYIFHNLHIIDIDMNTVIFICGNGGSASTASHFECDFNKGISYDQDVKYDFECLSDNVPMMMAIANDIGYDDIFITPLKNVPCSFS